MAAQRTRVALGVAVLLVLIALAAVVQAQRTSRPAIPLDPAIPNERVLIARGLWGVPAPGQPTSPIAVDRVVADGVATYVQYHLLAPPGGVRTLADDLRATLYDDTGAPVSGGGGATAFPASWARFLPAWLPWHPPVVLHVDATFGPLAPSAHAAVLRFMNGETVRVPLNLAALRHRRAYRGPLAQRAGLQLQVAAARDTGLVLGFAPFGELGGVTLTDARGHVVPLWAVDGGCSAAGFADVGLACQAVWAYPVQPRGTRLTLTIRSFAAEPNGAVAGTVGAGPWRLTFTIP
jgi:hypothetical protein